MAVDLNTVIGELETKIIATWPAIKPSIAVPNVGGGGLFEVDQLERMAFERVTGNQYAVIEWKDARPHDALLNLEQYLVTVEIHYVQKLTSFQRDAATGVRGNLESLTAALNNPDYQPTTFDLAWTGAMDLSPSQGANAIFLEKGMPWGAGSVKLELIVTDG